MARDWVLELKPGAQLGHAASVSLWVKASPGCKMAEIINPCPSIDEFRKEISAIKLELDQLLERAQREIVALDRPGGGESKADPAAVWAQMESFSSEEEMFAYFNSFSDAERELIAEYILSHVNMFKGRGPVFSEHYNASSHILE